MGKARGHYLLECFAPRNFLTYNIWRYKLIGATKQTLPPPNKILKNTLIKCEVPKFRPSIRLTEALSSTTVIKLDPRLWRPLPTLYTQARTREQLMISQLTNAKFSCILQITSSSQNVRFHYFKVHFGALIEEDHNMMCITTHIMVSSKF